MCWGGTQPKASLLSRLQMTLDLLCIMMKLYLLSVCRISLRPSLAPEAECATPRIARQFIFELVTLLSGRYANNWLERHHLVRGLTSDCWTPLSRPLRALWSHGIKETVRESQMGEIQL